MSIDVVTFGCRLNTFESEVVRREAGAAGLADVQWPNRGTLGGSLANNDPSSDYPAAVLGLGATVNTDRREIAAGTLTRERAKELLQCFWIKCNNQPAPPKVGITLKESGTYTDFANINSGGLTAAGGDGVNDVTYLILDVIDEMRLLQPSSNVQVSRKNPQRFVERASQAS